MIRRILPLFLLTLAGVALAPASAADNIWTNGAASSTWDTTSANWTSPLIWNNANVDSAIFGATGVGAITLAEPITARALQFDEAGYTIAGDAPNVLTLSAGGAGPLGEGEIRTNQSATISAIIAGSVGLTKTGIATLTLTGENTFSGGATVTGGTLEVGSGGTAGSILGNVANNAVLAFNRSDDTTFAGIISGSGAVNKLGGGTLTLTAENTYTGVTTINGGALSIGGGLGTTGSIVGDVVNNAALVFNRAEAVTYGGAISGSGNVTKLGAGTLAFTGANSYAGPTTITAGTLSIGNGGTTGSITGNIANSEHLTFNRSDASSYSGLVTGSGSVSKLGAGVLTLTGSFLHSGGTTVSAGTLKVGAAGVSGTLTGNVANNAVVEFENSAVNPLTYVGAMSGTGSLVKTGPGGTLTLSGDNTYTGGTTITSGTLQISSTGSIVGNVANNDTLAFNPSVAATFDGVISGSGVVNKLGSGTLTLTGQNTYTGLTTITGSSLSVGNGGTSGSIAGNVAVSSGNLTFNRFDDTTYAGTVTGTGTVTKLGAGTLTLTGDFFHTGGTTVSAGTLKVGAGATSGSLPGNVTNNAVVQFDNSPTNPMTFAGFMSGTGSLIKSGAGGVLTLLGNNSFTGGTTITGGTLQVGQGFAPATLAGNVANNDTLIFNQSGNSSFAGVISGTGVIQKQGNGTLTLTSANTYTGLTTISAGTLQVGAGTSAPGSMAGDVANHAALVFNRSDASAYGGVISGAGSVTKQGTGVLTFTGANTYTGPTMINGGSLSVGNGGTSGSIVSNVGFSGSGTNLTFNRSDASTYAGVVSGAGSVTKAGPGVLTLTGSFLHTGVTTVSGGTLQVGAGAVGGTLSGNVANNAVVQFDNTPANPMVYSETMSGTGNLAKTGSGTLTLTGNNTYTGGTTIIGGTLQVGAGGASGNIGGNVLNNGTLVFNRSNSVTFAGAIGGTGAVTKLGAGTLVLTADHTYTGVTTINAGVLQLGSSSTLGSIVGNIVNNSGLVFNRNDSVTYGGVISGTGLVTKQGPGTLTLTGANTYTGLTTIPFGILSIGNGGTSGSIAGNVMLSGGTANLTFNRSDNSSFSGVVSGTGTVTKAGPGVLTLTGEFVQTGSTMVTGGTLQVGDGAVSGNLGGNVINTAVVQFDNVLANPMTYAGAMTGTGSLIKTGSGILTLTANNVYTGGTTIAAGALHVGNGGTSGSLAGNIFNSGALVFNRASNSSFAGVISGVGPVTKLGGGTLSLTGENTYTGLTTISSGTLSLGNGGTTGSIAGNILNNANLTFNRSDVTSYGGVVSGMGTLTKGGDGTLALTGVNTYAGLTIVNGGSLSIGNGGTTGSIAGNVTTAATSANFAFNRSNAITYNGVVSGIGSLTQRGMGTTTLTGVHGYAERTTVAQGVLALTGTASISESFVIQVDSGATLNVSGLTGGLNHDGARFALASGQSLTGTGFVDGGVNFRDNTFFAPDGSTGTLSVVGGADFQPGSVFGVLLDGLTDTDADRTRLELTGHLTFSGSASDPFTFEVTAGVEFPGESPATFTIARAGVISSTGLDSPLTVDVAPNGTGAATNVDNIQLTVVGFDPFDKFTLQRVDSNLVLSYMPGFDADFDEDGDIDSADLSQSWTQGFGVAVDATHMQGDADDDADVDGADFLVWQQQFSSPPAPPEAAAVPEPAGVVPLFAAFAVVASIRRRRGR